MNEIEVYSISEYMSDESVSQNEVGRRAGIDPRNMSRMSDAKKRVLKNEIGEIRLIDDDLAQFIIMGELLDG